MMAAQVGAGDLYKASNECSHKQNGNGKMFAANSHDVDNAIPKAFQLISVRENRSYRRFYIF